MTPESSSATSKPTLLLAIACGALPGLFLLITSTTHLVEGQFVYDVKRLLQLCLLLVLFLAAALNRGLREAFAQQFNRIPGWVQALLGLIIVLGVISSAVNATSGMHLAYSLLEVALLTMLVLAVLVIAACRSVGGEVFDQVAITLLALTSIAVGIQELLGVAAALANDLEYFFRISLMHYSWPRFYNQVQAWSLPVLAALPIIWSRSNSGLLRSKWFQAIVCLIALALHWYIILMTGGRGVALSLAVSFVLCILLFPATSKTSLRWHLPGLVLGALLFISITHLQGQAAGMHNAELPGIDVESSQPGRANPEDWFEDQEGESKFSSQSMAGRLTFDSSGRWGMWRGSLRDIRAHPVIGNGPMNYACMGPVYRSGHPHNFLLQFAGEWGLASTATLLVVVAYLAIALWNALRLREEPSGLNKVATLLTVGLFAAAAYSMLSGVMVMPASQVAGILAGGWLMGAIHLRKAALIYQSASPTFVILACLMFSFAVSAFSFVEVGKREYRETVVPKLDLGIPRYWQHGKICKYVNETVEGISQN